MTEPHLDPAIVALREQFSGKSATAWRTELRITERLTQRQRRAFQWRFWLPVVALGIGSTAWAANRSEILTSVSRFFSPKTPPVIVKAPLPGRAVVRQTTESTMAPLVETLPSTKESSPQLAPSVTVPRINTRPNSSLPITSNRAPEKDDALTLYREAERMQFDVGDCAKAVNNWEKYLATDPHGPLVLEARYHRAECLLRLGRIDAARSALAPFAAGEYGSYRRDSARELLGKLPEPK